MVGKKELADHTDDELALRFASYMASVEALKAELDMGSLHDEDFRATQWALARNMNVALGIVNELRRRRGELPIA